MKFACPNCAGELEADLDELDCGGKCPHCDAPIVVPNAELEPGTVLGGFEILHRLASGGMAHVYLARQTSLNRNVALKVLSAQLALSEEFVESFLREARLSAKLDHANIVSAYDAGMEGGLVYLAMAFVDGESLGELLLREKVLSEEQALRITHDVATGLQYAWDEFKMIHRDIKPGNIMLTRRGVAKLTDMGLSEVHSGVRAVKAGGVIWGTPSYMSPEHISGSGREDLRSDLYALGCTLYHMLTGKAPDDELTPRDISKKGALGPLADPRNFNRSISPHTVTLLETMLALKPMERYPSWEVFLADLERVQAKRAPLHPRCKRSSLKRRREWKPILQGVTLTIAFGGLVVTAILNPDRFSKQPQPAEATPEPATDTSPKDAGKLELLQSQLASLRDYLKKNPRDADVVLKQLRTLHASAASTAVEPEIATEIERVEAERRVGLEMQAIRRKVAQFERKNELQAALEYLNTYASPFAEQTTKMRADLAAGLQKKLQGQAAGPDAASEATPPETAAAPAEEPVATVPTPEPAATPAGPSPITLFQQQIAGNLMKNNLAAARQLLSDAGELAQQSPAEVEEVKGLLEELSKVPERILASFGAETGKAINVELRTGVIPCEVLSVSEGRVCANRILMLNGRRVGSALVKFTPAELSAREALRRLGAEQTPALGIARGLMLVEMGRPADAATLFERSGLSIGQELAKNIAQ